MVARFAVVLAISMASYFALPFEPPLFVWVLLLVSLGIMAGILAYFYKRYGWIPQIAYLLMAVFGGFIWAAMAVFIAAQNYASPDFPTYPKLQIFKGTIIWSEPRIRGGLVDIAVAHSDSHITEKPYKLRLYGSRASATQLLPGCVATLAARVERVSQPLNVGGYDSRLRDFLSGRRGTGFISEIKTVFCPDKLPMAARLARLRLTVADYFLKNLNPPVDGVAAALVTGIRGNIPTYIRNLFRDSGLAHMLAISGLHMVLFAGSVFFIIRLLAACWPYLVQRYNIRAISAGFALLAAIIYLALSGSSYATQRAFIMISFMFIALMIGRPALTLRNVGWAAIIVLLIQPHAIMQAGFQMSFAAVMSLIALYERRHELPFFALGSLSIGSRSRLMKILRRIGLYSFGLFATSLVAGSVTGFLALVHFQQVGLYGLAANMLAMPIFGFVIMPMAFASIFDIMFAIGGIPVWLMGQGIQSVIDIAAYLTSDSHAVWRVAASPFWVLPLFLIGLSIICLARGRVMVLGVGLMIASFMGLGHAPKAVLHISDNARLILVRDEAGQPRILRQKGQQYELRIWLRQLGYAETVAQPALSDCGDAPCASTLFVSLKNGYLLGFVPTRDTNDLITACTKADIVLAPFIKATRSCQAVLIDRNLLRRGHALVFEENGALKIVTLGLPVRRLWEAH
ncbi:MAG: ComEC/Rec2 family competence protein [Parvibaculales bacterium]